jgi:hypothetical protein
VYIVAIEQSENCENKKGESLLTLVQPELNTLGQHWLMVIKDFALLSVPNGKKKRKKIHKFYIKIF